MVLLNLDAGEHAEEPDALWRLADILCVACGGHAGDAASMRRVVSFVAAHPGVALGAHPSYPDRDGFGRRTPAAGMLSAAPLSASLAAQCNALADIARTTAVEPVTVRYVKPHGALYHDASRDPGLAELVIAAARNAFGPAVSIIGPPHGALADTARMRGARYLREAFADRGVRTDGSLVPRGEAGALLTDPVTAAARARDLAASHAVDTICCHADTPGSLAIVDAVRAALDAE